MTMTTERPVGLSEENLLPTPIDQLTGVPDAIAPVDYELDLSDGEKSQRHHAMHPSTDPILMHTRGGRALRGGRLQFLAPWQHNRSERRYHRFWAGSWIPQDEIGQFGLFTMLSAGVLSENVLDTSDGEPGSRPWQPWEQEVLRTPMEFRGATEQQVAKYNRRFPELSAEEARRRIQTAGERNSQGNYQYIRTHHRYEEDFLGSFVVEQVRNLPLTDLSEAFRQQGPEAVDEGLELIANVTQFVMATTVYRGHPLGQLYGRLAQENRLGPGMPHTAEEFITIRIEPERRKDVLLPKLHAELVAASKKAA
jgi:hypothetical protein